MGLPKNRLVYKITVKRSLKKEKKKVVSHKTKKIICIIQFFKKPHQIHYSGNLIIISYSSLVTLVQLYFIEIIFS